jgi:cysteine desulfurase NifS
MQATRCGTGVMQIENVASPPRRHIYLDNNATTELAEEVREAMAPYLDATHGNPSSIHSAGRDAREGLEGARRQVAKLIRARPRRVIFTGGGSEADNLALKGVAFAARDRGRHIITTTAEHPAILRAAEFLESLDFRVTYLEVDGDGLVDPAKLEAAITDDTILVSIMAANNEVGTIQPVKELCAVSHARGVTFHTDAVQAAGKIGIDVEEWDVDLLTLSAHKFHGPKGVGVLYIRKGVPLEPLIHGGKQENGLRGGTENVAAIVGMGKAAELAARNLGRGVEMGRLRDELENGIRALVPEARLNGHREQRLPNTLNLTLPGLRGESLVVALDQHGISLSSGSACKSGSPDPTHVLLAMGRSADDAHCAVRLSLSWDTSAEDVSETVAALGRVLADMETTVRFLPCK